MLSAFSSVPKGGNHGRAETLSTDGKISLQVKKIDLQVYGPQMMAKRLRDNPSFQKAVVVGGTGL